MCSAAHAWVQLGRIVYAASSEQLSAWMSEWDVAPGSVAALPIQAVAPGIPVAGPANELAEELKEMHRRYYAH
jgi:tRNA(Arg) A34 adenosine deaminase TadA